MIGKLIVFFFEFGFGLTFNIVGTISLSELFLLASSFLTIRKVDFKKFPELKVITWLYLGLLISQIISELFLSNSFNNVLKGIAVTIVSYFHFYFLFKFFIKDRSIVVLAILGILARSFIFGTEFEGDLSDVVSGEGATILKFYVAPIIGNILMLLSIYRRRKNMAILIFVIGFLLILLGARSFGTTIAFTGLIAVFLLFQKREIKLKTIFTVCSLSLFIGYGFYAMYVDSVLKGNITSGNSWQIKKIENPYNPINLLIMGRTDTFVGMVAFADRFWTGHGAWADDVSGKYYALMQELKDSNQESDRTVIPTHSVLIGAGAQNGAFAFLFMGLILLFFIKKGFISLGKDDRFLIINIFFLSQLIWHGLFSPYSHFRLTLPLYFAFLFVSYLIKIETLRLKK